MVRPRHIVEHWWAGRPAPGLHILADEVGVSVQEFFQCHLHDTASPSASGLAEIPWTERIQAVQ